MAADTREIAANLSAFFDFAGRTVIDVGAGGGQPAEYARAAGAVIAVDPDAAALETLARRLREAGLAERFTLVARGLLDVDARGDVALFEFSLHEMDDPERALAHARALAPEIVVLDHASGSSWSWYAAEDGRVEAAWAAVERCGIRRRRRVDAWQRFADYAELEAKMVRQGPESTRRIAAHRNDTRISIHMPYELALVRAVRPALRRAGFR